MFVPILTDNGTIYVNVNHIVRIEKGNNHVRINLADGETLYTSSTIESVMEQINKVIKAS